MASMIRTALLLLLVVLILHETDGWRRRRRRRRSPPPCPRRNCQVSGWTPWSACTHRCGSTGTQYRTRTKTVSQQCGGVCPYSFRENRGCNRNACQNGGTPAPGYCRCRPGLRGTCCEIAITTTAPPTTTAMPTTAAPTTEPATTPEPHRNSTQQPNTTTEGPTTSIPNPNTTAQPTPPPRPTTSSSCFCYNGGTPICRFHGFRYCICPRGLYGRRCQYGYTTRPFTPTPSHGHSLRCYRCLSLDKKKCGSNVQYCPSDRYACFAGQYRMIDSGRTVYAAGCATPDTCRNGCDRARQSGKITHCLIRCCHSNLCNDFREPTPTPKRSHVLRMLLKLLEIFKKMIEAIEALIKAGLDGQLARHHKREIVSMMKRVDDTAEQFEDSSEPEVLLAKQDVAEIRMRAMKALKKLDDYIDADQDFENKK